MSQIIILKCNNILEIKSNVIKQIDEQSPCLNQILTKSEGWEYPNKFPNKEQNEK